MKYSNIYIIGTGKVAKACETIARDFFNQEVIFLKNWDKNLDEFCNKLKNCLIISANNSYIFKKECVENNTIINYHNALLPYHKGCNAHLWSIWDNDEKTGISWHFVQESIDTGAILTQKELQLNDTFTSLSLLNIQHNLAIASFKQCLQNLENKICKIQTNGGGITKNWTCLMVVFWSFLGRRKKFSAF